MTRQPEQLTMFPTIAKPEKKPTGGRPQFFPQTPEGTSRRCRRPGTVLERCRARAGPEGRRPVTQADVVRIWMKLQRGYRPSGKEAADLAARLRDAVPVLPERQSKLAAWCCFGC